MSLASRVPALQLCTRAALAAALSVTIAQRLGMQFPLYAMIAAVIVTDLDPVKTRSLALPRLLGTVLGAALGAALLGFIPAGVLALALGVFAAMLASQLLGLEDASKLAGYVCGLVLLEHSASPWAYAGWRLAETLLGVTIAVLFSFVPKLLRSPPPA